MYSEHKIIELKSVLKVFEDSLETVLSSLEKYQGLANIMLQLEAINKIRRYGKNEYMYRYAHNPTKNISSHMRIYLYHRTMEDQLMVLSKSLKKRIYEVQFSIYQLEQEKET